MKKGICCAGNMIVDITYPIETWPNQNELTHITEGISQTTGGAVCNTLIDLARLDPSLHLMASGYAGHDAEGDFMLEELKKYPSIDLSMVKRNGRTSFTAVMSNNQTKERTFFQHAGGNAYYGEHSIDWDRLDVDLFHIGYILLLPHLDETDEQYGTKMARLLHRAQEQGLKTSIDVVSETGDRFQRLVTPALKFTDYCIINELEAQQTTGICLRGTDGTLHEENLCLALKRLKELGVSTWTVIHCPELGCGLDEQGVFHKVRSLKLPEGYIKGTVGAGDAFCAGILYAVERGEPMEKGLKLGAATAAASLHEIGASQGVGSLQEMLALYESYAAEPHPIAAHITELQHIGLPTDDLQKTTEFYQKLGFQIALQTKAGETPVRFFKLGSICVEAYENHEAANVRGAIDHVAVDVDDIEACWAAVQEASLPILEDEIQFLPFWTNGVRFFNVMGPNHEVVEFSQML